MLKGCAPISDVEIVSCKTEAQLLRSFADYVRLTDPDILSGYNIQNFDIPYIMDRAKNLKDSTLHSQISSTIARLLNSRCEIRDITTTTNQTGTRSNKRINLAGRVIFDVYQVGEAQGRGNGVYV